MLLLCDLIKCKLNDLESSWRAEDQEARETMVVLVVPVPLLVSLVVVMLAVLLLGVSDRLLLVLQRRLLIPVACVMSLGEITSSSVSSSSTSTTTSLGRGGPLYKATEVAAILHLVTSMSTEHTLV